MIDFRSLEPKAKSRAEERYILKRKRKAWMNRLCFYLCRVFPIRSDLVSVCSYEGRGGFGCNPKYIVSELHRQDPKLKFIWFVNPDVFDEKQFPEYIKKVPNTLWNRAYWLSRSRVWIDNYRKPYGTAKRKGQYYLNTNHYTNGIKSVGLWRGEGFSKMAFLVSRNDSEMIDDLIIDSRFGEEMVPMGLVYDGNLLKTGAPRCDILYGDRSRAKKLFRDRHGLPENAQVVMFAPTFREGEKNGVRSVYAEKWSVDFVRLIENLEKSFGGSWYICVRVHPQLSKTAAKEGIGHLICRPDDTDEKAWKEMESRIIDESQEDDMYALLAGMDAYITDYSSACFEAGYARIPVFIYADDIAQYESARGSFFWDIREDNREHVSINHDITPGINAEFPFPICVDNAELEQAVLQFDRDAYAAEMTQFERAIGKTEGGNSAEKVCRIIKKVIDTHTGA